MTKRRLLLLDINGTINRCKSDPQGFINDPFDQEIIPEAATAIANFVARGWTIMGISNQGGIRYGYKTLESCIEEMRYTLKLVPKLRCIYFCPDAGDTCYAVYRPWFGFIRWFTVRKFVDGMGENPKYALGGFRKPQPGMLRLAIERFLESLAVTELIQGIEVLYVGDRDEDREAGAAAASSLSDGEKAPKLFFKEAEIWRSSYDVSIDDALTLLSREEGGSLE